MAEDVFGIVGTTQANAYKVESVVAEGGFGVVYRAYHGAFRAPVALKCLKIPQSLSDKAKAEFLERFREEAEVMFRLSASVPAVVRPLHVDVITTKDGAFVPFVALEWLEGETLDAMVARRRDEGRPPIQLKRLVRTLAPVARGLERAHNFPGPDGPISIVHRDLKPDNIFIATVNGEELAKILDFGIAKVKNTASQIAGRQSQTEAAMMAFTPGYGAPEQWLPKRYGQTGPWTDVWGLAITVVESIAGRPIIDGDHAAMMGTAIDEQRRPTPRTEGVQVTDEVEVVFQRALAVDPRNRQQDCGIFWDELEAALGIERTSVFVGRRDRRAEDAVPQSREDRVDVSAAVSATVHRTPMSVAPEAGEGSLPPLADPAASSPSAARVPHVPTLLPGGSQVPPPPPPPSGLPVVPTAVTAGPPASAAPGSVHLQAAAPASVRMPTAMPASSQMPAAAPTSMRVPAAPPPPAPTALGPMPSFGDERDPFEVGGTDVDLVLELDPNAARGIRPVGVASMTGQAAIMRQALPQRPAGPPTPQRATADVKARLGKPVAIALAGIGIATIDQVWAQSHNDVPIALGPVRLVYVAGLLAVLGTGAVLVRLMGPSED